VRPVGSPTAASSPASPSSVLVGTDLGREFRQRHGFYVRAERIALYPGIDHVSAVGREVGAGGVKAPLRPGFEAPFDLECPAFAIGKDEQEVKFSPPAVR